MKQKNDGGFKPHETSTKIYTKVLFKLTPSAW